MDEQEMKETMVGRKIIDVQHDPLYTGTIHLTLQDKNGSTTLFCIGMRCGDPQTTRSKTKRALGQIRTEEN